MDDQFRCFFEDFGLDLTEENLQKVKDNLALLKFKQKLYTTIQLYPELQYAYGVVGGSGEISYLDISPPPLNLAEFKPDALQELKYLKCKYRYLCCASHSDCKNIVLASRYVNSLVAQWVLLRSYQESYHNCIIKKDDMFWFKYEDCSVALSWTLWEHHKIHLLMFEEHWSSVERKRDCG